ncbi:MAG: S-methyl-5-thioribose-1-phosphate isomerase [Bacteroidia bacterium]|nr:S-methyl-5-thioribose-1-phosphate isomerase [Bacteroidia bacterium]MDW8159397.1 S-methyl-5-thioribose-1-phosphate isomerase [Bacteroidia bacterium]
MPITHYQSTSLILEQEEEKLYFKIIDQRLLPHKLEYVTIQNTEACIYAIKEMVVRGAPLIGIVGALGLVIGIWEQKELTAAQIWVNHNAPLIENIRPTAINLRWSVQSILDVVKNEKNWENYRQAALRTILHLIEQEEKRCFQIGKWGLELIKKIAAQKSGEPVQILTHCNAGALACLKWGTATAPIYMAYQNNIPIHVWVSETRPKNQGYLTAWELTQARIPHTVIVDNAAGYLIQEGKVDVVLVGSDRVTRNGDVANKIGTYLKALAAKAHGIPFYVALPSSTFDFTLKDGKQIPIETRREQEVTHIVGLYEGETCQVQLTESLAYNPAFDITPSHLVTALITERGICQPTSESIAALFPEYFENPLHNFILKL